jgi:hypothetical protein
MDRSFLFRGNSLMGFGFLSASLSLPPEITIRRPVNASLWWPDDAATHPHCAVRRSRSVVEPEETVVPEPQISEVRIKVLAAGAGFTDSFIRRGRYPDFKGPAALHAGL